MYSVGVENTPKKFLAEDSFLARNRRHYIGRSPWDLRQDGSIEVILGSDVDVHHDGTVISGTVGGIEKFNKRIGPNKDDYIGLVLRAG